MTELSSASQLLAEGVPGPLQEVTHYAKCVPCLTDRNMKIGGPKLELTRDPPTGDPLPLPTERQWKDGMSGSGGECILSRNVFEWGRQVLFSNETVHL